MTNLFDYNNIVCVGSYYRLLFLNIFIGGKVMYSMKETCAQVGLTYETLKYYCNEGLVPNVKRDKNSFNLVSG